MHRPAHPLTRALVAVALAASTMVLAGCGGEPPVPTSPPGPTAPPPGPTAEPPAPGPTAEPPAPTPVTNDVPTPVGGQTQPDVVVTAVNIAFQPETLTVAAGTPLTLGFDNRDVGVPHDLVLIDPSGAIVAQSEIGTGPVRVTVAIPALDAGTYTFVCRVHPNMVGTLTAE